ncbi:MAG: hypothetical protein IT327_25045 [Anaerolineae bacterium]|nr:hypothetical protein [Anaerolineae bacterium]
MLIRVIKKSQHLQPLTNFVFIVLAVAVLGVLLWGTWVITHQPDMGVLWDEVGEVYYAKPTSPIRIGDKIIAIDGVPTSESSFPYFEWQRDDQIVLGLARGNETLEIIVEYSERSPAFILALRVSVMLVAFSFWLAGTIMVLFLPKNKKVGRLFFLWCQLMALALSLGNITYLPWTAHLSIFFTFWIVPIAIHLHMFFPLQKSGFKMRLVLPLSYGISAVSVAELLAMANLAQFNESLDAVYGIYFLSWVLLGLLAVIFLLARAYFSSPDKLVRQQVGLVAISGIVSLLPLLIFSVLPDMLFDRSLLPTELMFIFLIGIPLGYSYAIRHYKLIKLERHISRTASNILVLVVMGLLYFGLTALMQVYLTPENFSSSLLTFGLIILLIAVHNPLKVWLQRGVDYVFYGGWYDYPTVIGEIAGSIEDSVNVKVLAETFCLGIRQTMRVHWSCLLLPETGHDILFSWVSGIPESSLNYDSLKSSDFQHVVRELKKAVTPLYGKRLLKLIGRDQLTQVEENFLYANLDHLWVPIKGKDDSLGMLLLGAKFGGDLFNDIDMEILDTVSRQVSIAFQKTQLISELTQTMMENERYQKEIFRAREEERKRIARELHDQVIQELVGLNYQTANLSHVSCRDICMQGVDLHATIGSLIQTTRELCADLRPPALDLGLIPSIRSLVARFSRKKDFDISLNIEGERSVVIPEDISLCLYQCTVESLSNIRKHAQAHNVRVDLNLSYGQILLTIQDDGQGFIVPDRLGSLMQDNHFGLVGIRERLELMGGTFQINSVLEQGTLFHACVPLSMSN